MKKLIFALAILAAPLSADPVTDVQVAATQRSDGTWRFDVTIAHPDTGWDHYADGWDVRDAEGTSLGFRELLHPHVNEQPFTRSLSGVSIPEGLTTVFIHTRCNVDGWHDVTVAVDLTE